MFLQTKKERQDLSQQNMNSKIMTMNRNKKTWKAIYILFMFFVAMSFSCNAKKNPYDNANPEITELKAHTWYYLDKEGFSQIDLPQNAPDTAIKPWTEAVRIAGAGTQGDTSCALVNRLGILDFSSGRPELIRDMQLFPDVTADSLLFTKEGPTFHMYRNSYFNTNAEPKDQTEKERPLLVRYDVERKICIPVLTYEDFGISNDSQVTSILPKNGAWMTVIKTVTPEKTTFRYMVFSTPDSDGSIPNPAAAAVTTKEIDADTFRQAQKPIPFVESPEQLKKLFFAVPNTFEFYLSCRTEGQSAAQLYDNTLNQSPHGGYTSQGCSLLFPEGKSVAVFSDGTTYITNSMLHQDEKEEGITVFRLPKLPAGFVYGEISIFDSTLYVAWEETDFYKTGRSGFIQVNLTKIQESLGF